ncbi:hypothetical protein OKW34_008775 [Paraburkholderia youngii]|uniref:BPSL0761 family protein n=1 Tax=Paraburkholderia youngii TaxID=2782701 RepID=UPI003D1F715D
MTMPYERALAVRQARELLIEISTGRFELEALKARAIAILRHYPGVLDMSIAAARAPTIFSEGFVASLNPSDSAGLSKFDALVDASPGALLEPLRAEMEKQTVGAVLTNTKWLTAEMVGKRQNPNASNMHHAAHRWKKAGKIFSIERAGQNLYPLYVFDELGNPIPEVAEILKIFKGYRPFRIASWFDSTNNMLHSKRPREVLGSDPAAVIQAAKDHVVGAVHGKFGVSTQ